MVLVFVESTRVLQYVESESNDMLNGVCTTDTVAACQFCIDILLLLHGLWSLDSNAYLDISSNFKNNLSCLATLSGETNVCTFENDFIIIFRCF